MEDMPSIDVIICTHDMARLDRAREAVASVLAQTRESDGITVVVDNNPELRDRLLADLGDDVRVIENAKAKGLSGARNTGVSVATSDVVVFLDDDAIAEPDWLDRLVGHYRDPSLIGVGGMAVPIWPDGRRPGWFPAEFDWVVGCTHRGSPEEVATVRNLIGCNMSFRRSVFGAIGGFEEKLGRIGADAAGCEETEFCIRASSAFPGGRFVFDPGAIVHHNVTPERTMWRYFRRRCAAEGRSKAVVAARWGAGRALANERAHARRLTATALRGIGRGLVRSDAAEVQRSAALLAGFGLTAGSYLRRRVFRRNTPTEVAEFSALKIMDVDLDGTSRPLNDPCTGESHPYRSAFCLVRKGGRPTSIIELPLFGPDIRLDQIGRLVADAAGAAQTASPRINAARALPDARVVVATRNRPETLAQCLDTLLAQDHPAREIVVVDNAPSDDMTAEMVAERYGGEPAVRYLREDRAGLGRAHNAGLRGLEAPVVAITDDDVLVDPSWLRALCTNFAEDETIGCATGLILPRELETRAQYWTECHGGFGKGFERRTFDLADAPTSGPLFPYAAGSFGSGANMAFSKAALDRIGGFDPALGAGTVAKGGDDLAAFVAVIRSGFRLVYEPSAIVWHLHRRNEEGMARQAYFYGIGLGAYLTKMVVDDPGTALRFMRAAPHGIAHMMGKSSTKNTRLPADYPARLRRLEQFGMLVGVPSYLVSRRRARAGSDAEDGAIA